MIAHLKSWWEGVRDSLWALPLAVAALCAALAVVSLGLDLEWTSDIAWLYAGGSRQAPEFAASLVGAMITLTALAFSITMVVLTLAAQQLGPRLIHIFMRGRGTQLALGLFLGTVIYLLLVLRALDGSEEGASHALAITVGTTLVLASVVTLLFFVHSLARSIVSDHVIARVGDLLDQAICAAFPAEEMANLNETPPADGRPVQLKERGYVQRIDHGLLSRAAQRHGARIELAYRPGAHVIEGETDAWVSGADPDKLTSVLAKAIVFGPERSPAQDPEWSARQLVEIGLRALSSGINDVFTALAIVERLSASLAVLMTRRSAPTIWRDEENEARIFGPAPAFDTMISVAFDQLREAGADKHAILGRIAANLSKLAQLAEARHARPLERQIALLERAVRRSLSETEDAAIVTAAMRNARLQLHARECGNGEGSAPGRLE